MQQKQNLELKYFCTDFVSIRSALKEIGAYKEIVKRQKDYFFNLPNANYKRNGRMKLRVENRRMTLIYYERPDFTHSNNGTSDVLLLSANQQILNFLTKTHGVTTTVKKTREVWRKDNTVFHLDDIDGVGKVFEIELQKMGLLTEKDKKIFEGYKEKVLPFLGKIIKGSNEDLVLRRNKILH